MRTEQRKIGTKPFSGQRFVEDGKVRIIWYPGGVPREVVVGPYSKKMVAEADDVLERALARARNERDGVVKPEAEPSITLGDLLARHLVDARRRRSKRTSQPLRPATLRIFGEHDKVLRRELLEHLEQPASELRRPVVREVVLTLLGRGLADKTVASIVDYLAQVYRWAHQEVELIEANPIQGVKVPSRKGHGKAYTMPEVTALLKAAQADRGHQRDWRIRTLIVLEAHYGARASQVIHLRWPDVHFDAVFEERDREGRMVRFDGTLTLRQDVAGSKGKPDRVVPMPKPVRVALLEAWNRRAGDEGFVLWNWRDSNRCASYQSMNTSLRRLEGLAKVKHAKGRSFHAFRRGIATALAGALGVKAASDVIGDTVDVTARTYVKEATEDLAAGMAWIAGDRSPGMNRESRKSGKVARRRVAG